MPDEKQVNGYTEAVDYLDIYIKNTGPLFWRTAGRFNEVKEKLEMALAILKSNQYYDGQNGPNP